MLPYMASYRRYLTAMHGLTAMAAAGKAALSQLKTAVSQLC